MNSTALQLRARRAVPSIAAPIVAVALAALLCGVILAVSGHNPFSAYAEMFRFGTTEGSLLVAANKAVPLYLSALAVAVGFIALAGVAAETGVVMLIYLDHAWAEAKERCRLEGRLPGPTDLYGAVMEGAVERVRPKMMTVVAIMAGLLPIMWGTGTGSEVMSRIAAPMVGGMISSTVLTLAVIPAIYALVKQLSLIHISSPRDRTRSRMPSSA